MRLVPVPLGFTYRMDYVPKGARNPRPGLFRGADVVGVRHIDAEEAEPAFRIRRPKLDIWPMVWPRTPRSNQWQMIRSANKFEILLNDGSLWWPLRDDSTYDKLNAPQMTAAECFHCIENDHHFFDSPSIDGCYDVEKNVPAIRKLVRHNRGDKLAQAQRKTAENILICNGKAYARGGMPIFFRNHHGNKKVWEIDIASVGPDRRADPIASGLEDPPGAYADHRTEPALGAGEFWLANDAQSAISAAHPRQTAFPKIEVLMPNLIENVRQQIRLDSIFRETRRIFGRSGWYGSRQTNIRPFKDAFDRLCAPPMENRELSRDRLDLLRIFIPQIAEIHNWEIDRVRGDFTAFDALERSNPTWPDEWAPEDLDALASLAN